MLLCLDNGHEVNLCNSSMTQPEIMAPMQHQMGLIRCERVYPFLRWCSMRPVLDFELSSGRVLVFISRFQNKSRSAVTPPGQGRSRFCIWAFVRHGAGRLSPDWRSGPRYLGWSMPERGVHSGHHPISPHFWDTSPYHSWSPNRPIRSLSTQLAKSSNLALSQSQTQVSHSLYQQADEHLST